MDKLKTTAAEVKAALELLQAAQARLMGMYPMPVSALTASELSKAVEATKAALHELSRK